MGDRGLAGSARNGCGRDTGPPHSVVVAALARRCHFGRVVRAEPGLAMAARLALLRGYPAASRQPEEFHWPALAVRVAGDLVRGRCARALARSPIGQGAVSVAGICAHNRVLFY